MMPYWFPHMLWECVAGHVTFHWLCQVLILSKREWEWEMVDVFGIVSLLLTYSTCFYEELWHYDGSINCRPFSDLVQSRRLCETKKDPSCCHLFRTWKRLKLCTNNLIALKMITSDQMSVDLINGLHSFCQVSVLISLHAVCPHYVTCWGQCCCCLTSEMAYIVVFSALHRHTDQGAHVAKLAWWLPWCP